MLIKHEQTELYAIWAVLSGSKKKDDSMKFAYLRRMRKARVELCDEWKKDYFAFIDYFRNEGYVLGDRMHVIYDAKVISPDTAYFDTRGGKQNANALYAKQLTFDGTEQTLREWAAELQIEEDFLAYYIAEQYDVFDAFALAGME